MLIIELCPLCISLVAHKTAALHAIAARFRPWSPAAVHAALLDLLPLRIPGVLPQRLPDLLPGLLLDLLPSSPQDALSLDFYSWLIKQLRQRTEGAMRL
jgi:hypothetical protein